MKPLPTFMDRLATRKVAFRLSADGMLTWEDPDGVIDLATRGEIDAARARIISYLAAGLAQRPRAADYDKARPSPSHHQRLWWSLVKDNPIPLSWERVDSRAFLPNANVGQAIAAVRALAEEHEILRTRLIEDGDDLTVEINPTNAFPIEVIHAASVQEAQAATASFSQGGLQVRGDHLAAARIISLPSRGAIVLVQMHHIISDMGSAALVQHELRRHAGVTNGSAQPVRPSIRFYDYTSAENAWFDSAAGALTTAYWAEWIAQAPVLRSPGGLLLHLSTGSKAVFRLFFESGLASLIARRASELATTPFILATAVYGCALSAWSGQRRFALRALASLRQTPLLASTIGPMLGHDLLEIAIDDEDRVDDIVKMVSLGIRSAMARRVPTHVGLNTGADYDAVHAPMMNFVPVGGAGRPETQAASWPIPLKDPHDEDCRPAKFSPVQLHINFNPRRASVKIDFNATLITADEQQAFVAMFLGTLRAFLAQDNPTFASLGSGGRGP